VVALYAVFAITPDTYFCEACGKFTECIKVIELPAQDADPPF
jgi:hypothetical protein